MRNHSLPEVCRTPLFLTMISDSFGSNLEELSHIPTEPVWDDIYDWIYEDKLRNIADTSTEREFIRARLTALATKTKRAKLSLFTVERFDRKWLDSELQ